MWKKNISILQMASRMCFCAINNIQDLCSICITRKDGRDQKVDGCMSKCWYTFLQYTLNTHQLLFNKLNPISVFHHLCCGCVRNCVFTDTIKQLLLRGCCATLL